MWEFLQFMLGYLITEGGIFGLLLFLSISWIGYREWVVWKSKTTKSEYEPKNNYVQNKILKQNADKIDQLILSLQNVTNSLKNFENINEDYGEKIELLAVQLKDSNKERVEDLKEVLSNYNSTMTDLSKTLEKIKYILDVRIGD